MRIALAVIVAVLGTAVLSPAAPAAPAAGLGYHPASVLVTFDRGVGASKRAAEHRALGARVVTRFRELRTDVVVLPRGLTPVRALRRYQARRAVARVSLNKRIRTLATPNDPLLGSQWGFHNTGQTVAGSLVRGVSDFDIDAPEAWDAAFPGGFGSADGTRVAVLDTGVDRGHADLLGKVAACASATTGLGVVVDGVCDDDNLHGTHTAGTVAANTNNGIGVAGTAPDARLAIFKFLNSAGVGFSADEVAGIRWAHRNGARVISMSFGSYDRDRVEESALKEASDAGALLVAAAGNDGDDTANYPASYPGVMSVAATNAANDVADFSTCNGDVEIAAPGEDIWSTFPGNTYGVISGTSMATPHVAGAAALVMSETGSSASQTRERLKSTATDVDGDDGRGACAPVRQLNLAAALGGGGGTSPSPAPVTAPGAIAGKVTAQKNRTALASAVVDCGAAGRATTGTNGAYQIADVPAGTHSCTASKPGYKDRTASVSVVSGATATADFALQAVR